MLHAGALVNSISVTHLWQRIFVLGWCFGILHPKSLPLSFENKLMYFASPAISRSMSSFVDKTMEGILFHIFYLFFHDAFGWWNYENNNIRTICISFGVVQSWCIRVSSKVVGKIDTMCFGQRLLFIFEQTNVAISFNRILFSEIQPLCLAHVSDDNCCKPQNAPLEMQLG